MSAIRTQGLTVTFGGVTALRGVDLEIPEGARWAVIGPNGAGKSTLFNAVGGQLRPTSGRIELYGQDITADPPYRRARHGLGRTWQITNLFNQMTVLETVALAVAAHERARLVFWRPLERFPPIQGEALRLLNEWGLAAVATHRVQDLAYGQQRLLEIVVALASRPRVLLLDEPTAGLSPAEAERMTEITNALPSSVTLVMIEHDMAVAFAVADTITVLVQGEVLASGPIEEVRRNREVVDAYLGSSSDAHG